VRTARKSSITVFETYKLSLFRLTKKGKSSTTSTSKTRKIIEIKKNRRVNGRRALYFGENPHSKGLFLSKEKKVFIPRLIPTTSKSSTNKKRILKNSKHFIIN